MSKKLAGVIKRVKKTADKRLELDEIVATSLVRLLNDAMCNHRHPIESIRASAVAWLDYYIAAKNARESKVLSWTTADAIQGQLI